MKKWLMALFILLILAIGAFYIYFSPGGFQQTASIGVNAAAFKRTFPLETTWRHWWPGQVVKNSDGGYDYVYNGNTYHITDKRIHGIIISIQGKNNADATVLDFLSLHPDSITLHWNVKLQASLSPLKRIREKEQEKELKKDIQLLQEKIRSHYSEDSNIYGIKIQKEQVRDSLLVSTFATTPNYPDPNFIYALIDNLKNYILSQGAEEKGYPMLNITTRDSLEFTTRVAIPVNRKLPGSGSISYKWMLGGGNILVTEVKGGPYSIRQAFRQMEHYVVDHNRIAPAIPFESLVTDRRTQKDTTQWITRLHYPVM